MLCTCQPGFEALLERELLAAGLAPAERGPGWVRAAAAPPGLDLAFAHLLLREPVEVRGPSVNALALQILDVFAAGLQGERIEKPWTCLWQAAGEAPGLSRRAGGVAAEFADRLKKKLSRVAKLAQPTRSVIFGPDRGLFVFQVDFDRAFVAREAFFNGPRRMADDPEAPSRSYLKVEEAYGLIGRPPAPGETVVDLGAAPGGWSYSAAQHGARVLAIDHGALRGGALGHPLIEHRAEDAFKYAPPGPVDWLFCDLIEEPHHVLRQIALPWLARGWCRRFVLNLKFGRVDPLGLLAELRADDSPFRRHGKDVRIRHLFHDREEYTVVGTTHPGGSNQ